MLRYVMLTHTWSDAIVVVWFDVAIIGYYTY